MVDLISQAKEMVYITFEVIRMGFMQTPTPRNGMVTFFLVFKIQMPTKFWWKTTFSCLCYLTRLLDEDMGSTAMPQRKKAYKDGERSRILQGT